MEQKYCSIYEFRYGIPYWFDLVVIFSDLNLHRVALMGISLSRDKTLTSRSPAKKVQIRIFVIGVLNVTYAGPNLFLAIFLHIDLKHVIN